MGQLTATDFQAYPDSVSDEEAITPGPLALYAVSLDQILPTQINEGLTEVGKKAAGFDLLQPSQLQSNLLTDIEPVVIGPDGNLYLLDGHHTFTALSDSIYGASDPTVYVDVVANYSSLTESQFLAMMQANNLLLPLNDGVPQTVDDATGAPIPASLTALTSDPYRGLEYSILKNKSSKLFTTTSNITGAVGAATPGLDKMTGFYSDFLEAAAYRDAHGGLGLPYLSPGDIALATRWNLTASSTTTLPNVTGTVTAAQLPGFILSQNLVEGSGSAANTVFFASGGISNATLASGALAGDGTFTGITEINAGTVSHPIIIGTPNVGFIMQLGADNKFTVTLTGTNTYTGGTSILAGTLIVASDSALGAAATGGAIDPANVKTSVQADNGVIFNSLSEGAGTLQLGTTSGGGSAPFSLNRPIAVGGEVAILNVNGYVVTLNGPLVSLGVDGDGIGNATGFSDFTVDDNSSNKGVLILSTPSPDFFGNLIIGDNNKPTVRVTSDAAMGNTTGSPIEIGQVVLNGGTFQAGASFSSVRTVSVQSKSTFDTAGYATAFAGALSDIQRNLTITNSNLSGTGAGAVTFGVFEIGSALELTLSKGSGTSTSVTFSNGIVQSAASDQLLLAGLGSSTTIFTGAGSAPTLTNGIAAPWLVIDSGASSNPYDFATYTAGGGFAAFSSYVSSIAAATGASVVKQTASASLSAAAQAYALNIQKSVSITVGTGNTLTLGDGNEAGLILNGGSGSGLSGGSLAFGTAEAYITINGSSAISSAISGSGGLNLAGTGTLTLSAVSSETGLVTVNSGSMVLSAVNVFAADTQGLLLQDTKNLAVANLTLNSSNQFATLDSAGNNSTITISNGSILTIGDSNNLSSTISSTISDSTATADAITKDGAGLLDLSGGTVSLAAGSSIAVTGGALRVATGALTGTATAGSAPNFVLSNGADLQFAQSGGGQYAGTISGAGMLHLIGGTLQLTGTNSYSGGTIVETGSTLDVTTSDLPTLNENITDAGGLIVFDQDNSGVFTGFISDGREMGTGPLLSGSLDKDDSTNDNAANSNVTIDAVQAYTGATYVEAGTLTLGVANAIANSSGVTLGRVGGAVDSQTAGLVLDADNKVASLSDNASNSTSVVLNGHILTIAPTSAVVSSFAGTISDGASAGGVIIGGGGTVALDGDNTFSGGVTIDSGTLELGNPDAAGSGAITFAGDPTLKIDGTTMPGNTIDGFVAGDTIDLASIGNIAGSHIDMDYATNVLTVTKGGSTYQLDFNPHQKFAGDFFYLTADSSGTGTDITEGKMACYCRGTLILTDCGERPVESLAIGDKVMTASGAARPIKWIGRRSYGGRFLMGRPDLLPIRIKAGVLGENIPRRDLCVSPRHAMYLEGVLIEANDLVDGVSIMRAGRLDKVEYFHVELDSHDVIIAEGAPSESFVDDDSRGMFQNAHEFQRLYPDAQACEAQYCAPRCRDGYEVEAVRRRIALRAGRRTKRTAQGIGPLRGYVDLVSPHHVEGWAQSLDHPEAPVLLDIFAAGQLIGRALANCYREDLEKAGLGSGRHGFAFTLPLGSAFAPAALEIRRSLDGAALNFSASCATSMATQEGRAA